MSEMSHYATILRSITQGRGAFTMSLLSYETVPPHQAQKIIEANKAKATA
jgi:elongation factor G